MAMDLVAAKDEIKAIIKPAAHTKWGQAEDAYDDFADVVADGIIAALQHIIDNAETTVDAEGIK